MSVAKLNGRRKEAGLPLIRFELRRLSEEDVQDLRDAYAAAYEISEIAVGDSRGYTAVARGHGYDQDLCHSDDRVFLTWHRAYVYVMERTLNSALKWKRRDESLELTLPFWDWTSFDAGRDAPNGLPKVVNDATYADAQGVQVSNPLFSAKSLYRVASQNLQGQEQFTQRFADRFRDSVDQLKDDVERYLSNPDYARFSSDLNFGAHGAIHVRVGGAGPTSPLPGRSGDMASVVSAAYDPIFWLHHSMIDKIWFDWQQTHGNSTVPQHVLDTVVYNGFVGRQLLDAERELRYIYSDEDVEAAEEVGATMPVPAAPPVAVAVPDVVATPDVVAPPDPGGNAAPPPAGAAPPPPPVDLYPILDIGSLKGGFRRAQLDFHQLHPPKRSFEILAFINNPDATEQTPCTDPSYAGRLMLFGHGDCHGARGHCNPRMAERGDYDLRPDHPLRFSKTKFQIDITRGLRRELANAASLPLPVKVTLITVDAEGNAVPQDSVRYKGVSLSTR
ncbi:MAG: tyrosinase family protein [Polyangiaceae bacterium]|nr:tyrosinase family protein [Polyangiaceae bacterium]MCB9610318.1 tyrosinase family protein [Polyangiaceae bacterium]